MGKVPSSIPILGTFSSADLSRLLSLFIASIRTRTDKYRKPLAVETLAFRVKGPSLPYS